MRRHAFVQRLAGDRLEEVGVRREADGASRGWVVEAAYLGWSSPPRFPFSLFAPLFGARPTRRVHLPFDDDGGDALGLLCRSTSAGVSRVAGRVEALEARDSVIDDYWLVDPFCRVVEMDDFVVIPERGAPIVVACGLAPLVIAAPRRSEFGSERAHLHVDTLRLLDGVPADDEDLLALSVMAGATVEVVGVERELEHSVRRDALAPATSAYRHRAERPLQVIGDEDGTRLIVRVCG